MDGGRLMRTGLQTAEPKGRDRFGSRAVKFFAAGAAMAAALMSAGTARAQDSGEANLKLPDLSQVHFLGANGPDGHTLLLWGILFCVFGLVFGMTIYMRLKNLPVHRAMREISELI